MKTVQLDSGGFIRVEGQFDLFAFTARDREFFSQVCDLFQAFEKNAPVTEKGDWPGGNEPFPNEAERELIAGDERAAAAQLGDKTAGGERYGSKS